MKTRCPELRDAIAAGAKPLTDPRVRLAGKSEAEFVALREAHDRSLPMPKLMLHVLQVNIDGGRLPKPEANGARYLKIPLSPFDAGG